MKTLTSLFASLALFMTGAVIAGEVDPAGIHADQAMGCLDQRRAQLAVARFDQAGIRLTRATGSISRA